MPRIVYRVADGRFPLFDGVGAAETGGRWNPPGVAVVYTAGSYAGGLLEQLVRLGFQAIPRHYVVALATLPDDLAVERPRSLPPGWDEPWDYTTGQRVAAVWLDRGDTAVLEVPSLVARPHEHTLVLNPAHPGFTRIDFEQPRSVEWDPRLFERRRRR